MAKVGRPTKYNEEMQIKADEYIVKCPNVVPSQVGLACYLKVSQSQVQKWGEKYPDFQVTLDEIKAQQHMQLLDGGLSGETNTVITKLMLCNHNYSDRVETKNETKLAVDVSNMTDDQLKAIINGKV